MTDRLAKLRAALTALGVVLVVAVCFFLVLATVVLGIGTVWGFVFGGGSTPDTGDTRSFELSDDDGTVTITYAAGEPLDATEIFVVVDDDHRGTWAEHGHEGDAIETGDSITIDDVQGGDEIRVEGIDDDDVEVLHRETV